MDQGARAAGAVTPKVFIKALMRRAGNEPVCYVVNENDVDMDLWLEDADGRRRIVRLPSGCSLHVRGTQPPSQHPEVGENV